MLISPTCIMITQEAASSLGFSSKVTARFPSVDATTIFTKQAKSPALFHRVWQPSGSQRRNLLLILNGHWHRQNDSPRVTQTTWNESSKFLASSTLLKILWFSCSFPRSDCSRHGAGLSCLLGLNHDTRLLKSRPTLAGSIPTLSPSAQWSLCEAQQTST